LIFIIIVFIFQKIELRLPICSNLSIIALNILKNSWWLVKVAPISHWIPSIYNIGSMWVRLVVVLLLKSKLLTLRVQLRILLSQVCILILILFIPLVWRSITIYFDNFFPYRLAEGGNQIGFLKIAYILFYLLTILSRPLGLGLYIRVGLLIASDLLKIFEVFSSNISIDITSGGLLLQGEIMWISKIIWAFWTFFNAVSAIY
jgi:hypothetical protein